MCKVKKIKQKLRVEEEIKEDKWKDEEKQKLKIGNREKLINKRPEKLKMEMKLMINILMKGGERKWNKIKRKERKRERERRKEKTENRKEKNEGYLKRRRKRTKKFAEETFLH